MYIKRFNCNKFIAILKLRSWIFMISPLHLFLSPENFCFRTYSALTVPFDCIFCRHIISKRKETKSVCRGKKSERRVYNFLLENFSSNGCKPFWTSDCQQHFCCIHHVAFTGENIYFDRDQIYCDQKWWFCKKRKLEKHY